MAKDQKPASARAELFAIYYVATLNATQSALSAGFAESGARQEGSRLLTNPAVKRRIQALMDERTARAKLDADQVLKRLDHFSISDPAECYGPDGQFLPLREIPKRVRLAIKQIKTFEQFDERGEKIGEIKEITFVDRVKATELLGKNLKLFNEEKTVKHTHTLESLVTGAGQRDVTPQGVSLIDAGTEKETDDGEEENE